jgi:uncharacterized surface protein with fasciclin (FAS1) repeats
MKRLLVPMLAISAGLAAGCATTTGSQTIAATAAKTPELSTLAQLIGTAGLTETLNAAGPYTVFAPTNEAFKALPAKTMEELSADKEKLKAVLTYHVVAGQVRAADVKTGPAKTVQGSEVALSKAGSYVTVEEAMVVKADVPASNGVVHVIDRVLLPPAPRR